MMRGCKTGVSKLVSMRATGAEGLLHLLLQVCEPQCSCEPPLTACRFNFLAARLKSCESGTLTALDAAWPPQMPLKALYHFQGIVCCCLFHVPLIADIRLYVDLQ